MVCGVLRIIRERMVNMTWGKTHMSAVCMVYVSKDVSKDVPKDNENADLRSVNPQRLDFTKNEYKNTASAKMPLQAIDVLFEDGVGVGLQYVDPSSKKMIGGSGLTVKEQEKRNAQLAESTN